MKKKKKKMIIIKKMRMINAKKKIATNKYNNSPKRNSMAKDLGKLTIEILSIKKVQCQMQNPKICLMNSMDI